MIDDIKKRLQQIHQKNGYLFDVTDISEAESTDGLRQRGIALYRENGCVEIGINARTRTLEQLKGYIKQVLDADFTITEVAESSMIATPKTLEGNTDAAT